MAEVTNRDDLNVSYGFKTVPARVKTGMIQKHFSAIAGTYDLADALLSLGLNVLWRKSAMQLLQLPREALVLDLCGGTGDFSFLAAGGIGPSSPVVLYDFNPAMIRKAMQRRATHRKTGKIICVRGDAENIAFHDNVFDAVMIGFGIRNLAHPVMGIRESYRVLKRGGALMILEFSLPLNRWLRKVYDFYSFRVMPSLGKLITGAQDPFSYLAESIRVFPAPDALLSILKENRFSRPSFSRLTNGIAVVYMAYKDS
ncbi:MAG TPA: ubiquinone/menaquinone biosynthesis methyltransferase [Syntrophorhabdaceae bacterium]|nr:ubiquinone/menaquinone biosynthesis methyltransferase [Syntrophorhabdaceae bacterium]